MFMSHCSTRHKYSNNSVEAFRQSEVFTWCRNLNSTIKGDLQIKSAKFLHAQNNNSCNRMEGGKEKRLDVNAMMCWDVCVESRRNIKPETKMREDQYFLNNILFLGFFFPWRSSYTHTFIQTLTGARAKMNGRRTSTRKDGEEDRTTGVKTSLWDMECVWLKETDVLDRTKWKNDIQNHSCDSRWWEKPEEKRKRTGRKVILSSWFLPSISGFSISTQSSSLLSSDDDLQASLQYCHCGISKLKLKWWAGA